MNVDEVIKRWVKWAEDVRDMMEAAVEVNERANLSGTKKIKQTDYGRVTGPVRDVTKIPRSSREAANPSNRNNTHITDIQLDNERAPQLRSAYY